MSAEYLTALASVGTFVVIAATAIVAIYQLRHIHAANQLTGALHATELFRSEAIQAALRYAHDTLPAHLNDPVYRKKISGRGSLDRREHPELIVADMFEQVGSYIKYGMIDPDQFIDFAGSSVLYAWNDTKEMVALRRLGANSQSVYENFEYLAVLSEDFAKKHGPDNYPRGVRRLMTESDWRNLKV